MTKQTLTIRWPTFVRQTLVMESGDIVLAGLAQADTQTKLRPVLLIKALPGYSDWLAAGISSRLHQAISGWDVVITKNLAEFNETGLKTDSVVRLSFLGGLPETMIAGKIGTTSLGTLRTVKSRLSEFLAS